jgi:hypothetical protein
MGLVSLATAKAYISVIHLVGGDRVRSAGTATSDSIPTYLPVGKAF